MLDLTMFATLINCSENGIIEFTAQDAKYYYEIFSIREETIPDSFANIGFGDIDIEEIDENEHIITLVTMKNNVDEYIRFIVQGKLIDIK